MQKFPKEVDNISTKDASSFQEVKNKMLNLHSAGGNGDSAYDTFGNKTNKMLKQGTKSSGSSSSKPGPFSYSKDVASSSKAKTCTWYTQHYPSKANRYGWHECSKLKEFNKSVHNVNGKGNEQQVSRYNPNTDSEVEGLIHQDAAISTTTKWIFDSGSSTHMTPDAVLFRNIWPFQSKVRVGNGTGIPVYGFGTVSLFVVLKNKRIKNIMLKDCFYIPGLMKSLFS
jgi:hypothetical protein